MPWEGTTSEIENTNKDRMMYFTCSWTVLNVDAFLPSIDQRHENFAEACYKREHIVNGGC